MSYGAKTVCGRYYTAKDFRVNIIPLRARLELPEGETWKRETQLAGREMTDILEPQRVGMDRL
ncbi:MAG: hypothetical protein AB1750_12580, partial [Chloroflexota bacterium]